MKINLDYIKKIAGNDTAFIKTMIIEFKKDNIENIELFKKALLSENIDEIKSLAHKCRSSFKNFGINEIAEKLEKIENNNFSKKDFSEQIEQLIISLHKINKECDILIK